MLNFADLALVPTKMAFNLVSWSLQTRTTVKSGIPGSKRLRAPMGPILGGIGSLGDGVPEGIAGDKKNHPGRYNGQIFKNPVLLLLAR